MGLAILMAMAMQATAVAAPSPPVRPKPQWAITPKGNDLEQYYPKTAAERNIEGGAVLDCRFTATGNLTDCKVAIEEPAGFGFGEAVLRLAPLFQARVADGLEGQPISIPIRFRLPEAPGPRLKPLTVTGGNLSGYAEVTCKVDKGRFNDCSVSKAIPKSLEPYALAAAGKLSPGDLRPGMHLIIPLNFAPKVAAAEAPLPRVYEVEFAPLKRSERQYAGSGPVGPYYPMRAVDLHLNGTATLRCRAGEAGEFQTCLPVEENPSGAGFEEAALRMADRQRIKAAGSPPVGQFILVRVPFTLGAPASVE